MANYGAKSLIHLTESLEKIDYNEKSKCYTQKTVLYNGTVFAYSVKDDDSISDVKF